MYMIVVAAIGMVNKHSSAHHQLMPRKLAPGTTKEGKAQQPPPGTLAPMLAPSDFGVSQQSL